jgi:hypothetical protein
MSVMQYQVTSALGRAVFEVFLGRYSELGRGDWLSRLGFNLVRPPADPPTRRALSLTSSVSRVAGG